MFDILHYVIRNWQQDELSQDSEQVARKLLDAGFEGAEVSAALAWLAGVADSGRRPQTPLPQANPALRVFAPKELARLDAACRGFLLHLEQAQVLTAPSRELVVEHALAATGAPLTLEQLKLIVLIVLWNRQAGASRLLTEDLIGALGERLPS